MNFLRKVKKPMPNESDAPVIETPIVNEDIAIEPTHDDITILMQLRVPRALREVATGPGFLAGQLVVATPFIEEAPFAKSVVYLFQHNSQGTAGLIINKPIETVTFDALFQGQNLNLPRDNTARAMPVLDGGPCERHRGFIIHSADYVRDFSISRQGGIAITGTTAIVKDMAEGEGPRQAALAIGCAIWQPGQLEAEIAQHAWVTAPASPELIFDTAPDLRWVKANGALGIHNMAFYSTAVGHA